jgi:hypothetical protein
VNGRYVRSVVGSGGWLLIDSYTAGSVQNVKKRQRWSLIGVTGLASIISKHTAGSGEEKENERRR